MDQTNNLTGEELEESFLHVNYKKHRRQKPLISSSDEEDEESSKLHEETLNDSFAESELNESNNLSVKHDNNDSIKKSGSSDNWTDGNEDACYFTDEDEGNVAAGVTSTGNLSNFIVDDDDAISDISLGNDQFNHVTDDEDIISSSKEIEDSLNEKEKNNDDNEQPGPVKSTANNDDSDVQVLADISDIVELSSEDEASAVLKDLNINEQVLPPTLPIIVNRAEYDQQLMKIANIEQDLMRAKNAQRVIKLDNLPDKGRSLLQKQEHLENFLQEQKKILNKMTVKEDGPLNVPNQIDIKWDEIEAGVGAVAPRTLGKKGVARFVAEKNMAIETLDELHRSLQTCPTENDFVEDPKGLKVPLMPHQKRALAWLLWRENQKPSGGILADDMGLGKTLTMIALIIKSLNLESNLDQNKENYRDKYPGGTLVVCPASLINQWSGEVASKTKRGLLSVEVHHGAKREPKAKRLARHDLVITTYAIVLNEGEKNGALFGVRWRRIILDEAHQIRNHKARTSEAVYRISGKSRWSLTGTPVHNKELDMYSQLKFLRCAPFDDLQVWKHWVGDKSTGGQLRLQAVISSLMLRRTKSELMGRGILKNLPERTWELIRIELDKDETAVYQKVLIFSRTLFAQFLHQRAMKNQDAMDLKFHGAPPDPNGEYAKMRNRLLRLNKVKEVNQHDILVLLLRLRQICCHPSLITQMLQGDEDLGSDGEEQSEELNLLEQLNRLDINDDENSAHGLNNDAVGLREASKGYLNPSNPVFMKERPSSKVKAAIKLIKEKISNGDKAIVVSQWTSFLKLVGLQLREARVIYDCLDGSIPVNKRMAIVDNFNDPKSGTNVLLLSLTAGGVGLNLIGANHLFLMDLHWNPQLENQAQDRIYRMGQEKPIFVYKLMAVETIEERIKALQENKLEVANAMLTGSQVINSKLTLQDLKLLFDFK